MKIVLIRDACPDRISCPKIYATDRDTLIVQGYVMDEVVTDQAVVEIPFGLVPGFSASDDLLITERETVLVRGARVTDPEALDTMRLPAGEDAVEVASTLLPVSTEER